MWDVMRVVGFGGGEVVVCLEVMVFVLGICF